MKPYDVKPKAWCEPKVIFYDAHENISAVYGIYKENLALGIRWNKFEGNEIGYPRRGNYPLWQVQHPLFILPILDKLLTISEERNLKNKEGEQFSNKIRNAIKIFASTKK